LKLNKGGKVVINRPQEPEQVSDFIPLELQNIVSKSLTKTTDRRYQIANEMRQDLQGLLPKSQPIYVQNQNETIIDESFSEKKPDIRLIPYRKGDKWGFCDEKKNIKIY
jgi:serine/threonine protein kinase